MLGHPFVVYGGQHSLAKIRAMGFETFGNAIDESYDSVPYPQERADRLVASLVTAGIPQPSHHNRLHFQKVANSAYSNLIKILQDIDKNVIIKENFAVNNTILNKYFLN
jgi:hypothetical protein